MYDLAIIEIPRRPRHALCLLFPCTIYYIEIDIGIAYATARIFEGGECSDLNSPLREKPGECVELSTCKYLLASPGSGHAI